MSNLPGNRLSLGAKSTALTRETYQARNLSFGKRDQLLTLILTARHHNIRLPRDVIRLIASYMDPYAFPTGGLPRAIVVPLESNVPLVEERIRDQRLATLHEGDMVFNRWSLAFIPTSLFVAGTAYAGFLPGCLITVIPSTVHFLYRMWRGVEHTRVAELMDATIAILKAASSSDPAYSLRAYDLEPKFQIVREALESMAQHEAFRLLEYRDVFDAALGPVGITREQSQAIHFSCELNSYLVHLTAHNMQSTITSEHRFLSSFVNWLADKYEAPPTAVEPQTKRLKSED